MPNRQLVKVIEGELGPNWQDRLQSFDAEPIASASIGQVRFVFTFPDVQISVILSMMKLCWIYVSYCAS